MLGAQTSPPAFKWDAWYEAVGGRSIKIDTVDNLLAQIKEEQYPRFTGEVNPNKTVFKSPQEAAQAIKQKALELGAGDVGIAIIEPSDIYKGREITEKYAIVVGQAMLWREFQNVISDESAIECMRVYFTLGELVIQLAEYVRNLGYPCKVEHPIGDSDVLHIPLALKQVLAS